MTLAPMRLLGRYSYGFYVYHVLFIPLFKFILPQSQPTLSKPLLYCEMIGAWVFDFAVILAFSMLSYHLLEMPFLRLKDKFAARHTNPDAQTSYSVAPAP
jgi:peptidoglycan/LPS O-acetylase OafA/YrhL